MEKFVSKSVFKPLQLKRKLPLTVSPKQNLIELIANTAEVIRASSSFYAKLKLDASKNLPPLPSWHQKIVHSYGPLRSSHEHNTSSVQNGLCAPWMDVLSKQFSTFALFRLYTVSIADARVIYVEICKIQCKPPLLPNRKCIIKFEGFFYTLFFANSISLRLNWLCRHQSVHSASPSFDPNLLRSGLNQVSKFWLSAINHTQ